MQITFSTTDVAILANALHGQIGRDYARSKLLRDNPAKIMEGDIDGKPGAYNPNLILASAFDAQAEWAARLLDQLVALATAEGGKPDARIYDA